MQNTHSADNRSTTQDFCDIYLLLQEPRGAQSAGLPFHKWQTGMKKNQNVPENQGLLWHHQKRLYAGTLPEF